MQEETSPYDRILRDFEDLPSAQRQKVLEALLDHQALQENEPVPNRSLLEAFEARGLVGSIDNAPADWSTNPSYLRGMGSDAQ